MSLARCSIPSVQIAAEIVRCLSNRQKEDLFTAGTASRSTARLQEAAADVTDTEFLKRILILFKLFT